MKKYDKVYIPAEGRSQTDYYMDREGDLVGLTELSGRIVLTIEELRDFCFETAFNTANPQGSNGDVGDFRKSFVAAFKSTLTSKGIHIP